MKKLNKSKIKICVLGLGYVGLPLAIEFGKKFNVIGYDINANRIKELNDQFDKTKEISKHEFSISKKLKFTCNIADIRNCNVYIITVPTPVYKNNTPDLRLIKKATLMVSKVIKKNDTIIYESTVFPGCTEEYCVPILTKGSRLKYNKDFFCGYSPERIVPGDNEHKLPNIKKIVSGSNKKTAEFIEDLYKTIIKAGIYRTNSIMIAEAAKVIENTQRDINIALVNELAIIFDKIGIKSSEVFDAVSTKWNALPFRPGLVGGHCIGVDPYYLTYKAKSLKYNPKIILAGRKLNDSMPKHLSNRIDREIRIRKLDKKNIKILILGVAFKENCNDYRNTKVIDLIRNLKLKYKHIDVEDPLVSAKEIQDNYQIKINFRNQNTMYDVIILAVSHQLFIRKLKYYNKLLNTNGFLFDVKSVIKNYPHNLSL